MKGNTEKPLSGWKKRHEELIRCAFECFGRAGIETTALADVAAMAQVGEATLYRHFLNKENLVLECGISFWQMASDCYEKLAEGTDYQKKSGIEQIDALLLLTQRLYEDNRLKFKFLHDLDVYLTTHSAEEKLLKEYEDLVNRAKPILCDAIEQGKADRTVTCLADTEEIYYTLTHTILSLMQKLAGIGQMLSGDAAVTEERRIALLRKLLLAGLRA